jgi:Ras-related protein Rab-28
MSDSEEEITEKQFKFVLLGDSQTGKSSIATKYAQETFSKQYNPTVGVEFFLKRTTLPGPRNISIKVHHMVMS